MSRGLITELERFASALIDAQQALLSILLQRRRALKSADLQALETLQPAENDAAQRLQTLIAWRTRLLEATHRAGLNCASLFDLAESLHTPETAVVLERLRAARALALELQQESWTQWIITNRCCHYYGQVVDMIAQGGKASPTYQSHDWLRRGGAILNASA